MEENILFLTLGEVMLIHQNQINLYGGSLGVRDHGLLEAALAQPEASFGGEYLHPDIYSKAAAYLYHLVMNHPFIDGNKRVATASTLVFLEMNDYELDADEGVLFETVMRVASSELGKDDLVQFFRKYTKQEN
ncbi:MAG: type II toxin-antitoxin system death-on-curing family toxin [Epsilonproteobacteria bacterium]|nr:MAG: type II toxin-antitoxin system death-on-curing family toxin [Campylobacterota bacterium]RLA64426.1 MAG: type II toxin-antitoxin system death-on-curing family toxin [Campylobacterota bacterium]